MSACQYEMKVPIRPAPPPPPAASQKFPGKGPAWNAPVKPEATVQKKKPPPRPPPPKFVKKSAPSRPSQLIADLFHRKTQVGGTKGGDAQAARAQAEGPDSNVLMLIDFSSPPGSPTLTTRSSSDALSVNSFGSDGVTPGSGSSGNASNVESGFEDDFDLFGGTSRRADAQPRDPWSPPPKPPAKWVTFPSPGATRKGPQAVSAMPTIIRSKPEGQRAQPRVNICDRGSAPGMPSGRPKGTPAFEEAEDDDGWSSESPPMPTCPPPAPPPEVLEDLLQEPDGTGERPNGVALYDYRGEQPGDLSFSRGDVVFLVRRIDENWFVGERDGREGSVPVNFLSVRVPLPGDALGDRLVTALYPFRPETWDDLELEEGSVVKVTHRIDQDWLYGECNGKWGQFPANFVDHVPSDLPLRRTG